MKTYSFLIIFFLLNFHLAYSQDTFSICAWDPVTGEVGSAGASCVANCIILSDVHPGKGVIHSQASYVAANQNYARSLFLMGLSPQQIIDSLIAHDVSNNPTIRQYGIVKSTTTQRAGYTGVNCLNYKNHITGPTYMIQGNILLGQQILDSMEARFNREPGSLAKKLMAALQGAKVIGADTRCASLNKSSISAFLRIGRTQDTLGSLYLDLRVNNTPTNRDPIDSLQVLFNMWNPSQIVKLENEIPGRFDLFNNYPNPFNPVTTLKLSIPSQLNGQNIKLNIYDINGKLIEKLLDEKLEAGVYQISWNAADRPSGIYIYSLITNGTVISKKMMLVK